LSRRYSRASKGGNHQKEELKTSSFLFIALFLPHATFIADIQDIKRRSAEGGGTHIRLSLWSSHPSSALRRFDLNVQRHTQQKYSNELKYFCKK